ncbi:MAG TPA: hypothetical protein VFO10_13905 [Oligoflexus sp.]|uniref:hypothetical protein n=1 Tax=Oligoflexus sp. TaxID=1971216 RepID=UPI002D804F41|nr:hypothetical protein [Oligoflexus sp.]HET9238350.1 hypothetical protein [Oligoflexus sp.]
MHRRASIAAILGLILMISACSSEGDDAQQLPLGSSGSDAAFSYYDANGDRLVTAAEIYRGEKKFGATQITSDQAALNVLVDYDFDANKQLDNLEFTGLVHAHVLSGTLHHPEWVNPQPH